MRVAIVTDSLSRDAGGLFESVRRLCQEMSKINGEVEVFGVSDRNTSEDLPHWRPLKVHVLRCRGPQVFGYAPGLIDRLMAFRPQSIQIHGIWQYISFAVLQASRKSSCPYVVNAHGMLDPWAVRNSYWKKAVAAWLYEREHLKRAACIRALCPAEAHSIRAFGLHNPICIIPNAIDVPAINDRTTPAQSPFPRDHRILLYLGRIHPKKGLMNLLDAWAVAQKSPPPGADPWILVIAGWQQGTHQRDLQRRAAELGLDQSVLFIGPQFDENKADCYRYSDAVVLPSFSEGLPMTVLEAWAYAKPVLMTPECNLPQGFAFGAANRIETNVASIAAGIKQLFASTAPERHAIGKNGLALVKKEFTWPTIAAKVVAVQNWVVGGGAAPETVIAN